MNQQPDSRSPSTSGRPRGRRIFFVGIALVVVGSSAILVSRRRASEPTFSRIDTDSPYLNTRRGVKYVGNAACSRCHAEIAGSFRQHPMGRSLFPIETAPIRGDESGDRVVFEAMGLQYSIENRQGHVVHKETRRDARGRVVAQNEAEVQFAVGAGRQGIAYLIDRDGFLFQSPISWYPQQQRWDLAPGYQQSNSHFDRPITPSCLFCHANRVDPVPGTDNQYRRPIFQGHAIGCERCHGPGELHVTHASSEGGKDLTIVNPGVLEPALRDAVCEQCHLNGQWRVLRADRRDDDYRPGLPFYRFWTVLERAASPAENRIVGQFEQLHESLCFRASEGRLGCIFCHDPHRIPDPRDRASYFRRRCLECHADRGCSLPVSERLKRSRDDDCSSCHMPRLATSNMLHVATTDHRIRRHADGEAHRVDRTGDPRDGQQPVVNYHRDLMDERERAEAQREVGVAFCRAGRAGAAMALPLLEEAVAAHPDDVIAWEAKGFALGQLNLGKEGLAAFKTALSLAPDRESALTGAAYLAARAGLPQEAIGYWRRAIAICPWRSDYHAELAPLYFQIRDWHAAADACRKTLRLNPSNLPIRKLLIRSSIRLGNAEAARRELDTLLGFDPPDRDDLLRWFTPLARPEP